MVSEDERKIVVNQIKKFVGANPLFYLKFVKERNFAEDIKNGKLYSHSAAYFRDLEINSGECGQGDQFELINIIECTDMKFINQDTGNCDFTLPKVNLKIRFESDDNVPIVSFVGLTIDDLVLDYYDENHASFLFPFTEEEFDDMCKKFGPYCTLIDGIQLRNVIEKFSYDNKVDYIFDKVQYCTHNTIERIQAFANVLNERFLYKNENFKYQREYRLAINMQIPNDNFIRIGSCIKVVNCLKSSELKNIYLSIGYELSNKEFKDV